MSFSRIMDKVSHSIITSSVIICVVLGLLLTPCTSADQNDKRSCRSKDDCKDDPFNRTICTINTKTFELFCATPKLVGGSCFSTAEGMDEFSFCHKGVCLCRASMDYINGKC